MTSKFTELAIDCADPYRLAEFWCAVLGYEVQDEEEDGVVTIGSPVVPEGRSRPGPVPPTLTARRNATQRVTDANALSARVADQARSFCRSMMREAMP